MDIIEIVGKYLPGKSYIFALVLGFSMANAGANTVSYTSTLTGTFDFSGPLALQQFDTALGSLNSVTITISGSSRTSLTVTNTSPDVYGPSWVWNDVKIKVGTVSIGGSSSFDQDVDALNPNGGSRQPWLDVTSPQFEVTGLAAGAWQSFNDYSNTYSSGRPITTALVTNGPIFTALQGPGTVNLDIFTTSSVNSSFTNGATFLATETVTGGVTATVTYDYSPIPEPSSYVMVLGGFGAFVLLQRMRHRR